MKHADEKALIAHAMGLDDGDERICDCADCQRELAQIQATLATLSSWEVPEISQRPILLPEPKARGVRRPLWAGVWAGAIAAALIAAFALGRFSRPVAPLAKPAATANADPSRVLLVVVADHLDRTQALLVELEHPLAAPGARTVDLSLQQSGARELLASNRLYQQGADRSGDRKIAQLLAGLEPILLQIAQSPDRVTAAEWTKLEDRIAESGILFQVRVADENLQATLRKSLLNQEQHNQEQHKAL
ncbi:MAG TPA: hypothetical protein VN709_11905 [Terriglobales bacterium]|nr:hypothetical protein [Terriglobales bacterium]